MLERLPMTPGRARGGPRRRPDPLHWATGGGEADELLLTCAPGAAAGWRKDSRADGTSHLTVIGRVDPGRPRISSSGRARRGRPAAAGYGHFGG